MPTAGHLENTTGAAAVSNKVFLVHGRDSGAMHEVARFLEKIGLDVTILHERPNRGRTLISKFQEESADISFAVVLMTPDDSGSFKGEKLSDRARQNVVFELGFFIGRLGAENVCALVSRGVERPRTLNQLFILSLKEMDGKQNWPESCALRVFPSIIPKSFDAWFEV
jgi:predicted nucleotide-binding protein